MIWIVKGDNSYSAIGVNIALKGDASELWIERPTGKTVKIVTDTEERIKVYKEAIDFAIKSGKTTFEL